MVGAVELHCAVLITTRKPSLEVAPTTLAQRTLPANKICNFVAQRGIILSYDHELWSWPQTWPRKVQDEPTCQMSRSKVILDKSCCPDTQTYTQTHGANCFTWTTKVVGNKLFAVYINRGCGTLGLVWSLCNVLSTCSDSATVHAGGKCPNVRRPVHVRGPASSSPRVRQGDWHLVNYYWVCHWWRYGYSNRGTACLSARLRTLCYVFVEFFLRNSYDPNE